ncbi:MAG: adenosylmethionine--8-amino-7-oxononanoate transaminase [bacterium]|nr:adenosylmethionine--8-amino-7-oxononanoate transaminase [bacterium]
MHKDIKKKLKQIDLDHIWHPFTQMQEYGKEEPVIIEKAYDSFLVDIDGKKYLDGVSSLWVNIHGHRRKEIDRAIIKQIKKVSHTTLLGLSNTQTICLAKKLVEITPPNLKRVFFSDNGSTGVEIALKIGFQYWQQKGELQKNKFVSFIGGYHGDTLGAVSVGGMDLFHKKYKPLLFNSFKVPCPYCYRCSKTFRLCNMACLKRLKNILEQKHEKIIGVIIEPLVQCAGGIIVAPEGFLRAVSKLCKKYGVLLIADEVATGFGRTGKMFACEHEKVKPDIMIISKGLTGGYLPLAATLVTEEIYNQFLGEYDEHRTFYHGHSYTGNSLACAAALASIRIFEEDRVLESIEEKIEFLQIGLKGFDKLAHVGDIRQKGLIAGIELVENKDSHKRYPPNRRIGHKVILEARKRGLIIRPLEDVIVLIPPLSIRIKELSQILKITYDSIKAVTE